MRTGINALAVALSLGSTAEACDLALLLAVDVSGSVVREEYNIQMNGLAAGLRDGIVADALVEAGAKLSLMQWTGSGRQEISIPWHNVATQADVEAFASAVENTPRQWRDYSTALGEALEHALVAFSAVSDCRRKVVDVSGDGPSNEGVEPRLLWPDLRQTGIIVNALVIETEQEGLTDYFRENVIFGGGAFAVTANSYDEYPDKIRRKLIRETSKTLAFR